MNFNPTKLSINTLYIEETPSTNTFLREWIADHPLVRCVAIYTDNQTAGRGQRGNSWKSEPHKNLTFSIMLSPTALRADHQFVMSQMVALAVAEVLDRYTEGISIKWSNDVYWHNKKLAGMLIENDLDGTFIGRSIVGIGLNLNQLSFPAELPNPVSLAQITDDEYSVRTVLDELLGRIELRFKQIESDPQAWAEVEKLYLNRLYRREGQHWFEDADGRFRASIAGIAPRGELLLLRADTNLVSSYAFKEVKFVI